MQFLLALMEIYIYWACGILPPVLFLEASSP